MKIQVIKYRFDISKEAEQEKYNNLVELLKSKNYKRSTVLMSEYAYNWNYDKDFFASIQPIEEVDTNYVFADQLNTVGTEGKNGKRLHFWTEYKYPNKDIKEGYYIEDITEYLQLLDKKVCCAYCGKQQFKEEVKEDFCTSCLGSEYLTPKNLHLTVLRPIKDKDKDISKSINNDTLSVITLEHEKQFAIKRSQLIEKKIKQIQERAEEEIQKVTRNSNITADLKIQLLTLGYIKDNIIFYSHNNTVSLNWTSHNQFTPEEEQHIKENLILPEGVNFK